MGSSCDASATRATRATPDRPLARSWLSRTLPSGRGPMYAPPGLVRALSVWVGAIVVAALAVTTVGARPVEGKGHAAPSSRVAIFFYPWYGTPERDGSYQHWNQHGSEPPESIASSYYPARGIYSSTDSSVLRAQMGDISGAEIRVVIVSWWGPGSPEDARLPLIVSTAQSFGLRVAIHIEPYQGRTPQTVAADVARLRTLGIRDFYVYDSTLYPDTDWAAVNIGLSGVRLFANTSLPGKAAAGGFAGLYTYDVYQYDGSSFPRMCASARRLNLVCAPSVGAGYDARATGDTRFRDRAFGATYDAMWRSALRARADVVTITSYNEWHEGTQIEPAADVGSRYESYDGAWGLHGKVAQRAYLDRTAWWVDRYRAMTAKTLSGSAS
jgi:glycoprotein endo-alpha-1,2-mannosidase